MPNVMEIVKNAIEIVWRRSCDFRNKSMWMLWKPLPVCPIAEKSAHYDYDYDYDYDRYDYDWVVVLHAQLRNDQTQSVSHWWKWWVTTPLRLAFDKIVFVCLEWMVLSLPLVSSLSVLTPSVENINKKKLLARAFDRHRKLHFGEVCRSLSNSPNAQFKKAFVFIHFAFQR